MQRSFLKSLLIAVVAALALTLSPNALAQGQVSSGITGTVADNAGKVVAGATVTILHVPTNTSYTAITGANGRFQVGGLRIGGPYSISAKATNYEIAPLTDVQTSLGEPTDVSLVAAEGAIQLEKLVVTGSQIGLDANATGTSSVLNNRRISSQPTIFRSFQDLMKTNPYVSLRSGAQTTAVGTNNRFNSVTLDGARINDVFGLSSSGLFSLNNPFSLDAIEQFSVSIAPYDVRESGFTGAAMNAVSKSGTNEFHGTAYYIYTDADQQQANLIGSTKGQRLPLKERTYGYTFGGPLWKNHLFFFVNFERFLQQTAGVIPPYTPDPAFLTAVQARIAQLPGNPNLGTFPTNGAASNRQDDRKRLLKLDWNINQDHRMTLRYSDTIGAQPFYSGISTTSFSQPAQLTGQPTSFPNGITGTDSGIYYLNVIEKVWAAQMFSNWSSNLKTELKYSRSKQNSLRSVPVNFPEIRIFNVPGTSNTNGTTFSSGDAYRVGTETSSQGNSTDFLTQSFSANADYSWKSLLFTAGVDREQITFDQVFRQGSFGIFNYANLSDFQNDIVQAFERAVVNTNFPLNDYSKFAQTGFFGQAKWEPNSRLNLTFGVRVDQIGAPIKPPLNTAFQTAFGVPNNGTVDGTSAVAPRFSFNYALDQKRRTQIRGGIGVFLGRNPWVWISNTYGNSAVGRFTNTALGAAAPTLTQYLNGTFSNTDQAYKFDPKNPIGLTAAPGGSGGINLIKPGLKLPTIVRGNLAIEQKLPGIGAIVTLEYVQTKMLENFFTDNMNLRATTIGADGRQRFAGSTTAAPLVPGFLNVLRVRNIGEGGSQYASIMLDHPFHDGWAYNVVYTRGHATDAQSFGSSTASSNWTFNNVFNQNTVEVGRSDFEIRDRVQASLSHEHKWGRTGMKSTVSLYYEGRTGNPYGYVYSGDLNGDGISGNDLIAVPKDSTDARFDFTGFTSSAQQDAYFNYLNKSGLAKYAGGYAPKNSFFMPWQNRLDLRFVHEMSMPRYHNVKLELFADFINFGSWLDKNLFNYIETINASGTNGSQQIQFGNASYNTAGLVKPTVTLNADNSVFFSSSSIIQINNSDSRWRIQTGARIKF